MANLVDIFTADYVNLLTYKVQLDCVVISLIKIKEEEN